MTDEIELLKEEVAAWKAEHATVLNDVLPALRERDAFAETLKAIVDCYGVGSTPEKFCEHVHDFIMRGRKLLADSGHAARNPS